ncbi:hypothetical protein DI09_438p10, partial [Mitosporidium daphniae]
GGYLPSLNPFNWFKSSDASKPAEAPKPDGTTEAPKPEEKQDDKK